MEWWQDSPIQPLIKVYIYNYTNIDDYLNGRAKKMQITEVGPYVYKEFGQRVHLTFHDEHKITFYVSFNCVLISLQLLKWFYWILG